MSEKIDVKTEALPDLDDLLQCPVCYEIPSGQIFQCNEGHHVCGQCKLRLDVCPVCRALFFGTRNYAMEELIASIRKLRAFKLGGKITTGSSGSESNTPADDATGGSLNDGDNGEDDNNSETSSTRRSLRPPQACKGLFRCLCCKNGKGERLPSARLLNHLRYFHAPELIEGQSESGEYVQAWQFSTVPGRIVTAVRVSDMGIYFLIIEMSYTSIYAWLAMAAAPWVAREFCYTITISGNDREAIFSDCVWSVRSCEGTLKKRGHCLSLSGEDARALIATSAISGKVAVRRAPADQPAHQAQPRAVLRVASRGSERARPPAAAPAAAPATAPAPASAPASAPAPAPRAARDVTPFLINIENVVRLSREIGALVNAETESQTRSQNVTRTNQPTASDDRQTTAAASQVEQQTGEQNSSSNAEREADLQPLSRNARRRMRQRLRAALNATQSSEVTPSVNSEQPIRQLSNISQSQNSSATNNHVNHRVGIATVQQQQTPSVISQRTNPQVQRRGNSRNNSLTTVQNSRQSTASSQRQAIQNNTIQTSSLTASIQHVQVDRQSPEIISTPSLAGPSNGQPQNTNRARANKKKRRHRR